MIIKDDICAFSACSVLIDDKFAPIAVREKKLYSLLKRIFDIFASAMRLIVLSLSLLLVAIIVLIDSPGTSPIYVQERVGINGRIFKFYKFRSMFSNAEDMLDSLLEQNEMTGPDFKYMHKRGIKNDILILPKTIRAVCGLEGV